MLEAVVLVALLALATYLVVRVGPRRWMFDNRHPLRAFGPDDDRDFLRELDSKRRHLNDPEV